MLCCAAGGVCTDDGALSGDGSSALQEESATPATPSVALVVGAAATSAATQPTEGEIPSSLDITWMQLLTIECGGHPAFSGDYTVVGRCNGWPHWTNVHGVHLYRGPRNRWLLRNVCEPESGRCSGYHSSETLLAGAQEWQWLSEGTWQTCKLTVLPRLNVYVKAPDANFSCLYKVVGEANGRLHWESIDAAHGHTHHMYFGPRQQFVLRSKFEPEKKTCSGCTVTGSLQTGETGWKWLVSGQWAQQQVELQLTAGGVCTDDGALSGDGSSVL